MRYPQPHVPSKKTFKQEPPLIRYISGCTPTHQLASWYVEDFLAAMMSTRISLHDDLLRGAFQRFDVDNSGYLTKKKPLGRHRIYPVAQGDLATD